jgi:hypothetical protein
MSSVQKLVTLVYGFSAEIRNGRSHADILRHTRDELAELHEEVAKLKQGVPEGDDGVTGESVDLILCVLDLLYEANYEIGDVHALIDSAEPFYDADLDGMIEQVDGEVARFCEAVEAKSAILATGVVLIRTLLDLIDTESMDTIEAIALKKCEKWKLHYSNSIDRQR